MSEQIMTKQRLTWFFTNTPERDPLVEPTHKLVLEDGQLRLFEATSATESGWTQSQGPCDYKSYGRSDLTAGTRGIGLLLDIIAAVRSPDLIEEVEAPR